MKSVTGGEGESRDLWSELENAGALESRRFPNCASHAGSNPEGGGGLEPRSVVLNPDFTGKQPAELLQLQPGILIESGSGR